MNSCSWNGRLGSARSDVQEQREHLADRLHGSSDERGIAHSRSPRRPRQPASTPLRSAPSRRAVAVRRAFRACGGRREGGGPWTRSSGRGTGRAVGDWRTPSACAPGACPPRSTGTGAGATDCWWALGAGRRWAAGAGRHAARTGGCAGRCGLRRDLRARVPRQLPKLFRAHRPGRRLIGRLETVLAEARPERDARAA